jgi:hypothetical protein
MLHRLVEPYQEIVAVVVKAKAGADLVVILVIRRHYQPFLIRASIRCFLAHSGGPRDAQIAAMAIRCSGSLTIRSIAFSTRSISSVMARMLMRASVTTSSQASQQRPSRASGAGLLPMPS